jgi:cytochrome b involved in lipid metabolism
MKLKILTGLMLSGFFIFITTLLTAGMVNYYEGRDVKAELAKTQAANDKLADASAADDPALTGALTEEAIAKHKTAEDCWLIVDGNVYDVTVFVAQHPGGSDLIVGYCGGDATAAFNTRDKNPPEKHSSFAASLLRSYYIGPVGRLPENILYPDPNDPTKVVIKPFGSVGPIPTLTASQVGGGSSALIDAAEVAKHSTLQNCWLIVSGKVYDITSFSAQHPGGQATIAPYCGKDGTQAYQSKGGQGGNHSAYAYSLLGNYFIANLGSSVALNNGSPLVPTVATSANPTATPVVSGGGGASASNLTLSVSEIATHNILQNCWLIISGSVYNVTSFISQHPGGVTQITNWCGKDGTSAFQTKGGKGSNHSSYAYSLLNPYLIGSVGSSVSVNATPTTTSSGGGSTTQTSPGIPSVIIDKYPEATLIKGEYEDDGRWEGKVNTNSGCRSIKVNSSGNISEDKSC